MKVGIKNKELMDTSITEVYRFDSRGVCQDCSGLINVSYVDCIRHGKM